jgi:hypothetical protein
MNARRARWSGEPGNLGEPHPGFSLSEGSDFGTGGGGDGKSNRPGAKGPEAGSPRFQVPPTIPAAAAIVREAGALGVRLTPHGDFIDWRAERAPPEALLAHLRARKAEVLELLRGDRCRHCGDRLAWPVPVGVVHGDGQASCFPCHYQAAARRAVLSPDALADAAELTARGEPLP